MTGKNISQSVRMQDAYARDMSQFGLRRGLAKTRSKHKDMKHIYADFEQKTHAFDQELDVLQNESFTDYVARIKKTVANLIASAIGTVKRAKAETRALKYDFEQYKKKYQKAVKNKGFSLIEVIVTITIIAILGSAISISVAQNLKQNREVKDEQICDRFVSAIQELMRDAAVRKYVNEVYIDSGRATDVVIGLSPSGVTVSHSGSDKINGFKNGWTEFPADKSINVNLRTGEVSE